MTYEGGPRVCGYCAGHMHDQCDGSAWCEATQQGADCPCGHPSHSCPCVIVFAGTDRAERITHPTCPNPFHRRQDRE